MNRKKLINDIISKSSDEFESKDDFLNLAMKSKKELIKDLIKINQYILDNN
tara:strand:+ start:1251 stop:1403 length:153 start_codon:yes stop_codon:yes gene_type:complete